MTTATFVAPGPRSISDDDLCSTCSKCTQTRRSEDLSDCSARWPGLQNADGYVILCPAFNASAKEAQTPSSGPVYARRIAAQLESYMEGHENCSIHWAKANEKEPFHAPALKWPESDADIGYLVKRGYSEGCLIYVVNQPECRNPSRQDILITIKVICGLQRATEEVEIVQRFIEALDLDQYRETAA